MLGNLYVSVPRTMEVTFSSGGSSNASSECAIDGGTNRCRGLEPNNGTCILSQEVKDLYR